MVLIIEHFEAHSKAYQAFIICTFGLHFDGPTQDANAGFKCLQLQLLLDQTFFVDSIALD
jgi:hypothetical protein